MKKQICLVFGVGTLAAIFGLFLGLTDRPSTVSAQSGSSCSGPYIQTGTGANCVVGLGPGSIASPSTTAPIVNGTAAAGTSAAYSRGDHVHPTDTSRQIALSLLKGTYSDGLMCTYATTGTLLNCNTAIPVSATSTNVVAGVAGHAIVPTTVTLTAVAPTVSASQVGLGSTVEAPGAGNCPSVGPTGCLIVNVAGTPRDVPYY